MNFKYFKDKILPHLIAVVVFTILSYAYMTPLLNGDRLQQHDYIQGVSMCQELVTYDDTAHRQALWTEAMFSGMPSVQIVLEYPTNLIGQLSNFVRAIFIHESYLLFLLMLGFYVMLFPLVRNSWLAIIGAIAFAFGSFNLISIEAGHLNKMLAICFIGPIIGGLVLAYRGRWFTGAAIFAVFFALQLRANHLQITYYTGLVGVILGIYCLIEAFLDKQLPRFAKATAALGIGALLALGTNTAQIWGTYEYAKATIRGSGSELSSKKNDSAPNGGLDTSYAFSYSEGVDEILTTIIPDFKGGGQMQSYSGTDLYKKVTDYVEQERHMNPEAAEKFVDQQYRSVYYWGEGGFSAGPIYFGAIVCFLFILGLFIIRSPIKWALLTITILAVFLAWGRNFSTLNYFLFYHFPMYNKFRTPSMLMTIANIMVVFTGILALKEVLDNSLSKPEMLKRLKYAAGVTLGILTVFGLLGSIFYSYHGNPEFEEQLSKADILSDVMNDRKSLLQMDTIRSIIFVLLAIGLIWAYVTQKIKLKQSYLLGALGFLILIDLWTVDKRCFNDDAFVSESEFNKIFKPKQADQFILQDRDLSYRVLDERTGDPFTNARTSYFHKSIGGYHAAKIRIYQELIENQISRDINALQTSLRQGRLPDHIPALNMLNTRYFVFGDSAQQVVRNPGALGNAWFVQDIKYVNSADDEMASLNGFDPKKTAIVRNTFKDELGSFAPAADSTAKIELTNYVPDRLTYQSTSQKPALAVFSEVYYLNGKDWKVFIDGKVASHIRANYVLRAMVIPAGTHKIEFRFEPPFYADGEMVALIASLLIIAGVVSLVVLKARGKIINL